MKAPRSVRTAEDFGRVRLSPSFYMRDFLHSEIGDIHGISNLPDDPDLAITAGTLGHGVIAANRCIIGKCIRYSEKVPPAIRRIGLALSGRFRGRRPEGEYCAGRCRYLTRSHTNSMRRAGK